MYRGEPRGPLTVLAGAILVFVLLERAFKGSLTLTEIVFAMIVLATVALALWQPDDSEQDS